ncbi:Glycosyl transferase family 11 [Pedobacter sp. ok626]|uniref:alpha-1,2-fucosyltransferase n=1 Tax=Pedobacter sp. ok626 TaxID=1761882 RepID=UPI000885068B|nr:alpha-1,2-fucosyltransferase [Pedobacter sp. ok626]SDK81065.1 Glycosyl transferase family 11 [Pedobacter sp. ok626]
MKIVKFLGGLGNQMFQYAFYLSLRKNFNNVKADISNFKNYTLHQGFELNRIFNIDLDLASSFSIDLYNIHNRKWMYRKLRSILGLKKAYFIEAEEFQYRPQIYQNVAPTYYDGYWQNENYFSDIEGQLRKAFEFKKPLTGRNLELAKIITSTQSVSIHIRRGDYLNHPVHGNICNLDYYSEAKQIIDKEIDRPQYFIFSDDINWCIENLNIESAHYINWNTGNESYIDLQLMSLCKNQIIANSTFSWWGAWLNTNENKLVIAPKKWLNTNPNSSEILLEQWIKI